MLQKTYFFKILVAVMVMAAIGLLHRSDVFSPQPRTSLDLSSGIPSGLQLFGRASITTPFPDISDKEEALDALIYLFEQNILHGDGDGNFHPDNFLNRAEWAVILTRISGAEPSLREYHDCFPDVKKEWFAPSVCLAKNQGWITGYQSGEFKGTYQASLPVLDIEVLVTLARLTGWELSEGDRWYEPALQFAQSNNIYDHKAVGVSIMRKDMAEVIFRSVIVVAAQTVYRPELNKTITEQDIYDIIPILLSDYEGVYSSQSLRSPDFDQNDLICDIEGNVCSPEPIPLVQGEQIEVESNVLIVNEISHKGATLSVNGNKVFLNNLESVVEDTVIVTLIDFSMKKKEVLLYVTPYPQISYSGLKLLFSVDYLGKKDNLSVDADLYEDVLDAFPLFDTDENACFTNRERSIHLDIHASSFQTGKVVQNQSIELVHQSERLKAPCSNEKDEEEELSTGEKSSDSPSYYGEYMLEVGESIDLIQQEVENTDVSANTETSKESQSVTLSYVYDNGAIAVVFSGQEILISRGQSQRIQGVSFKNVGSFCQKPRCAALVQFGLQDGLTQADKDIYLSSFSAPEGRPGVKEPLTVDFRVEGMKFDVEIGSIGSALQTLRVLLYDHSVGQWVFALNEEQASPYFTSNRLNNFSSRWSLFVDKALVSGSMQSTLTAIDSAKGFIFVAELSDGQHYLLGKSTQFLVPMGKNPLEFLSQITPFLFHVGGEACDCDKTNVTVFDALKNAFSKKGIDLSIDNLFTSWRSGGLFGGEEQEHTFTENVECGKTTETYLRLSKDLEVLPNYDAALKRYKETGKKQQGADYLLFIKVYTFCDEKWVCQCWFHYRLVSVETGQIKSAGFEQDACGNLEMSVDAMLEGIHTDMATPLKKE